MASQLEKDPEPEGVDGDLPGKGDISPVIAPTLDPSRPQCKLDHTLGSKSDSVSHPASVHDRLLNWGAQQRKNKVLL